MKSTAGNGVRMLTLLLEQGCPGSSKYNDTGPNINPGRQNKREIEACPADFLAKHSFFLLTEYNSGPEGKNSA